MNRGIARSAVGAQRRFSSITERFSRLATDQMQSNKDKNFQKMLETMSSANKWTLKSWRETLDSQLNSWLMYIPGMSTSNEAQEMKKFKAMLDTLNEEELNKIDQLTTSMKEQISIRSGKTMGDVNRLALFYNQSLLIHRWLALKKQGNEFLPTSEEELMKMQENDSRIRRLAAELLHHKKSGRGRKLPF